ncbi:MAG TPA: DUF6504 family protein [Actinomycetes bacterium]|nr:DUF6504 family protein [Actinomycetes bacterium]
MRRYDEPISVEPAVDSAVDSAVDPAVDPAGPPARFRWRRRRYVVHAVLAHWVELGAWWRRRDREGLPVHLDGQGRYVWRVEARAGATDGVFDLAYDEATGTWSLTRAHD